MKNLLITFLSIALIIACNSAPKTDAGENETVQEITKETDAEKGIGKFEKVELGDKLDLAMASKGKAIAEMKCLSCHKLTDERVVGPGWKGVTTRRKPEWIMNFLTNVDQMLDKDPEAQAMLEVCLIRMPNQNLTEEDARNSLEFMRQNDGVK